MLTVQAKDGTGNNLSSGGLTVTITKLSGTGTISAVTDNGNGTYTATVTAPTLVGSVFFVATLSGQPVKSGGALADPVDRHLCAGRRERDPVDALRRRPASITANGCRHPRC